MKENIVDTENEWSNEEEYWSENVEDKDNSELEGEENKGSSELDSSDYNLIENDNNFIDEDGNIKLMSDYDEAFELRYVSIKDILVSDNRVRKGINVDALRKSIRSTGLLNPIVVAPVATENKYILVSGFKRLISCAKEGKATIPCVINKKIRTSELSILEVLYNHYSAYKMSEIVDFIEYLEREKGITNPSIIEYVMQLEDGDYTKLKDILNDNDEEIIDRLMKGEYSISTAFKKLEARRKKESKENKEIKQASKVFSEDSDNMGVTDTGESVGEDNIVLSEDELKNLGLGSELEGLEDKDLGDMVKESENIGNFEPEVQKVGERHPVDPAIRKAVMSKFNDTCQCCGEGGESYVLVNDFHHIVPVFLGGADSIDNATCLCCKCHRQVHLHARGQLFLPDLDTLNDDEKNKFKKILAYGNIIRKAMEARGMKLNEYKKNDNIDKVGRDLPGKLNSIT